MIEDSFLDAVVSAHLPHRLDLLLELLEVLGLRFASEDGDLRPAGSGDQCHCRFSLALQWTSEFFAKLLTVKSNTLLRRWHRSSALKVLVSFSLFLDGYDFHCNSRVSSCLSDSRSSD